MGIPGTNKTTVLINVLVLPSGASQVSLGSPPIYWVEAVEKSGAIIRVVKATLPLPLPVPIYDGEDVTDAAA